MNSFLVKVKLGNRVVVHRLYAADSIQLALEAALAELPPGVDARETFVDVRSKK